MIRGGAVRHPMKVRRLFRPASSPFGPPRAGAPGAPGGGLHPGLFSRRPSGTKACLASNESCAASRVPKCEGPGTPGNSRDVDRPPIIASLQDAGPIGLRLRRISSWAILASSLRDEGLPRFERALRSIPGPQVLGTRGTRQATAEIWTVRLSSRPYRTRGQSGCGFPGFHPGLLRK
jgi:hypothetical protein